MNRKALIDPVAFLQIHIARLFMERHELSPEAFLAMDARKDIFGYLRLGYEPFHLTGDDGILEELDAYVYSTAPPRP